MSVEPSCKQVTGLSLEPQLLYSPLHAAHRGSEFAAASSQPYACITAVSSGGRLSDSRRRLTAPCHA